MWDPAGALIGSTVQGPQRISGAGSIHQLPGGINGVPPRRSCDRAPPTRRNDVAARQRPKVRQPLLQSGLDSNVFFCSVLHSGRTCTSYHTYIVFTHAFISFHTIAFFHFLNAHLKLYQQRTSFFFRGGLCFTDGHPQQI